jgi:putative endopeptidase
MGYEVSWPMSRRRMHHRAVRPCRALAVLVALVATSLPAATGDRPLYGPWGLDLTAMDTTVRPGDDFNRYASGAWLARTRIPEDESIFSLRSEMSDRIESRLRGMLERAAAGAPARPVTLADKAGAFYKAFLDTGRIEKLGMEPIRPQLDAVRAAPDREALAALMGRTNKDFEGSLFTLTQDIDLKDVGHYAISIGQGGLGLPDRDYYLQSSFADQKRAYQAYVARLLRLVGWPAPDASATAVVAFETRIAEASWSKVEQRDPEATYNPMSRAQLRDLAPGFDWAAFLDSADLDGVDRVIVAQKSAFPALAAIFASTPLEVSKAWLAFTIADNAAFYLSRDFSDARFEFREKTLAGQQQQADRWKLAIRAVAGGDCTGDRGDCWGNLGFGVGQLYAAEYFPPASKAKIEALVVNIQAAMRARLERLDWMSPATRAEALRKLDTYQIKVGYPDRPRDYSKVEVRADDLIGDARRAAEDDWRFHVERLDGPVDRSAWLLAAHSNNAYNGTLRDIVFPAGILQPPIFDPAADPALNYGAIGAVIGHELTHGFDDEGRKLDADGKLRDWWTPADAAAFESRARKLSAQYSTYEPVPGAHINGDLTLGENIADLGGLSIALDAYHRSLEGRTAPVIDGFSGDQRVFLGWAQAWRGKAREDYVRRQVVIDEHSPRAFRVIGPMRNIDAWYAAFGVKEPDKYYVAPDERVRIW